MQSIERPTLEKAGSLAYILAKHPSRSGKVYGLLFSCNDHVAASVLYAPVLNSTQNNS